MMPYKFGWYEHNKIVLETYDGNVTADELLVVLSQTLNWLSISENILHFIIDWRNVIYTPNMLEIRTEIQQMLRHKHTGYYAIVGINPALEFWVHVFENAAGLKSESCDTIEDAAAFIKQIAASD